MEYQLLNNQINFNIEINQINLDDIRDFNANVFEYEQTYNNKYMLSLLLISFIDLGIIEFL